MAEIGQVTEVKAESVVVRLFRQEACAKCGACTAGLESKDMFIEANNVCHATKEDWVEIYLEETNFIKAVAIMYGLPLVGLLLGVVIGTFAFRGLSNGFHDLVSLILGLLGAGIVYTAIHLNEGKFKTKRFRPKAVRIVTEEQ